MELVLELEIPPRAEYIAIARLVVSSLASSRRALGDERIDDLKLAVAEACTTAAMPSAEAIVQTRRPAATPNDVASPARRP